MTLLLGLPTTDAEVHERLNSCVCDTSWRGDIRRQCLCGIYDSYRAEWLPLLAAYRKALEASLGRAGGETAGAA